MEAVSSTPLVSVIIPAYNAQEYVAECVTSVTKQTLKDIEIIVVDDGSTDRTREIVTSIAEQDGRVTLLTQSNQYAGVARNNGMDHATGKYLYFLDADDFIEPNALETMASIAERTGVDIVVARSNSHDAETHEESLIDYTIKDVPTEQVLQNAEYAGTTFQSFIGWPWDKLFRASFVREQGLRFQALRTTNDAFFTFVALAVAESIYCTDTVLFHHRTHNASSLEATRKKSWQNALNAVTTIGDHLKTIDNHMLTKRSYENWVSHFILWNVQSLERPTAVTMMDASYPLLEALPDDKDYYYEERDYRFVELVRQTRSQLILTALDGDWHVGDLWRQLCETRDWVEVLEKRIADRDRDIAAQSRKIRDLYESASYRVGHAALTPFSIAKDLLGRRK
ncbi:glycosyltransferase family 2 protein [Bifidobacterium parmae]|uniref:Glycosyltransferases involved in cell wall biogenesis n=1 Tax=Bifidobacterium parmae TaxID=361854 RepID=A0A2N5J3N4_9BIFI|nr:glycosyltransferase family 2 protein [Bifidobacterium parmae]PLS28807.1 glycosyltransferases involved in cell wall biogenesis [Bifidobacterium parmae]